MILHELQFVHFYQKVCYHHQKKFQLIAFKKSDEYLKIKRDNGEQTSGMKQDTERNILFAGKSGDRSEKDEVPGRTYRKKLRDSLKYSEQNVFESKHHIKFPPSEFRVPEELLLLYR